ncbi:MAG: AAA family ATPase [Sphingobium sp.]|nr:AAA family ATPase [Sphingobium sp.]MCP5398909.1 AAA family ATPase [Sphingomonas sp.]
MTPVFGHDRERDEILSAARAGRLHHGWIFAGPHGIGKASLARQIALCLLADGEQESMVASSHPSAKLFEAGTHPDYAELRRLEKDNGDLARNISVDQVRSLSRLLSTSSSVSKRRIILIDAADDMERGAANALLKSLEEPPRDTIFLLISHSPSRLLPTIRSRCRMLRLSPLGSADMAAALRQADPAMDEDEHHTLLRMGEGSPGRALALAGLGIGDMVAALERISQSGDPSNAERIALAKTLAIKSARPRYEAFLEQAPAYIATRARELTGPALAEAIAAWEAARDLAMTAIPLSLDPATTVFELCSHAASLAEPENEHALL